MQKKLKNTVKDLQKETTNTNVLVQNMLTLTLKVLQEQYME